MATPKLLLIVALGVVVLAVVFGRGIARELRLQRRGVPWPFVGRKPLTDVEQVLFQRLVQALPQHVVLAHVRLSRFLAVRKGRPYREWIDRVSGRGVDFLVCRADFSIVAAIDLDVSPYVEAGRASGDPVKNRALAAAGVPLVRWHVASLPDFDAIRAMIGTVLEDRSGGTEQLPSARVEPTLRRGGLETTRIEASNDPVIVGEEQRQ